MSDSGIAVAENSHRWVREEYEHYVEPEWCSQRLFAVEKFDGTIQDPFCGFGRIVKAGRDLGLSIFGTDIVNHGFGDLSSLQDFMRQTTHVANIVGNPPFDRFREFAEQGLRVAQRKVALIWLVRTLPAARWLDQTPLARVLFLTPRPSMPPGHVITAGGKPSGGKQDFCWLIWDHAHSGAARIGWLRRYP